MKTWDMIEVLYKNPQLKAKSSNLTVRVHPNGIGCGLVYCDCSLSPEPFSIITGVLEYDWEIIRQPVSFNQAVMAFSTIQGNAPMIYVVEKTADGREVKTAFDRGNCRDDEPLFTMDQIEYGEWFIVEKSEYVY